MGSASAIEAEKHKFDVSLASLFTKRMYFKRGSSALACSFHYWR